MQTITWLSIIAGIVVIGSSVFQYFTENQNQRKKIFWTSFFSFIGGMTAVILAITQYHKNAKDKKHQTQIENILTGGDNKPFIIIEGMKSLGALPKEPKRWKIFLIVKNIGQYPIHDVSISIIDDYDLRYEMVKQKASHDSAAQEQLNDWASKWKANKEIKLGTIPPKFIGVAYESVAPDTDSTLDYFIKVSWNNGIYTCNTRGKLQPENDSIPAYLLSQYEFMENNKKVDELKYFGTKH